jgi:hypothetical protein
MAHLRRYLCLRRPVCTRIEEAQVDETLQKASINVMELKQTLAVHGAQIDAILARSNSEAH